MEQGPRLSERSEFERGPGWAEHRKVPAAKRRDADTRVAFFWLTFILAKQKKVSRPPRRQSGIRTMQSACSFNQKQNSGAGVLGVSINSPTLRPALRVLRFAAQRNCDPTPKTSDRNKNQ